MHSFRVVYRRVGLAVGIALLLLIGVTTFTSAAQLTERSIALSNSSLSATGVTYQVTFTAAQSAGAFVVDFCSNTPLVGVECDEPTDFDVTAATSATSGFTDVNALDANTVVVTGTINADAIVSVDLAGLSNPSVAGPLYARIVTYDTAAHADNYTSTNLGTGSVDDGGVAISITSTIGVAGSVLESMTFCISGSAIAADCGSTTTPVLQLGETLDDTVVLVPDEVSEGSMYTQISTNAANGAVVRLKSNATGCGGLKRIGAPAACDIQPALNSGITANEAKFGVKTTTPTNTGTNPNGTFQPVTGSGYNTSTFALNYASDNTTGVTSAFGDPFLDTNGAPVNNKNMQLIFGASINKSTPAGVYTTDLNLIATGRF